MSAPELDFDELDRAITNVLNDKEVQKEAASMSSPQPSPLKTITNNQPEQAVSQKQAPLAPSKPAPSLAPPSRDRVQGRPSAAPASSVASRLITRPSTPAVRRGVIDIMSPPSKRPSRQGQVVQPVNDITPSTKAASSVTSSPSVSTASTPKQQLPPEERALRWPPRADEQLSESKPTAGQVQQESHQAFETHHTAPPRQASNHVDEDNFERFDALPSDRDHTITSDTENQIPAEVPREAPETDQVAIPAPTSPFLSDAKVEKRPLGGYGPVTTPEKPLQEKKQEAIEQTPVKQAMPAEPLLEAHYDDEPPKVLESSEKPVATEAVPENAHTGVRLDHLLDDGNEHSEQPPQTSDTAQSTMQSIPQQYNIADQKSSDTPRPIFDTNEYHAPLSETAAPKRSGKGLWITLIVILLLAVAGGVLIYFFGSELGL